MRKRAVALVVSLFVGAACGGGGDAPGSAGDSVTETCPSGSSPTLFALDLSSGKTRWSYCPAVPAIFTTLGATDDVVLAASHQSRGEANELVALDAATGAERWRTAMAYQQWAQGPVAGSGVVVVRVGSDIAGLDAKTGKERWRAPSQGFTPVAGTEKTVVIAGANKASIDVDPSSGPVSPGFVRGLDRTTGKELWSLNLLVQDPSGIGVGRSPAAVVGSTVVVPIWSISAQQGPSQLVVALDATKGTELWRAPRIDHPSAADGVVVGRSFDNVIALDAGTGRQLWTAPGVPAYGELWTLGSGAAYVLRNGEGPGAIVAYDLRTGSVRWQFAPSASLFGEPMGFAADLLLVGWESVVGALSAANGDVRWTFRPALVAPSWITSLTSNKKYAFVAVDNFAPTD